MMAMTIRYQQWRLNQQWQLYQHCQRWQWQYYQQWQWCGREWIAMPASGWRPFSGGKSLSIGLGGDRHVGDDDHHHMDDVDHHHVKDGDHHHVSDGGHHVGDVPFEAVLVIFLSIIFVFVSYWHCIFSHGWRVCLEQSTAASIIVRFPCLPRPYTVVPERPTYTSWLSSSSSSLHYIKEFHAKHSKT